MKNSAKALLVFVFLSFCRLPASAGETLTLVTMPDFPPYAYIENGQPTGLDVDIIKEMAHRVGLGINIEFIPWKRVIHYTKYGTIDGAFPAFKKTDREEFAHYVNPPLHKSLYKVFVNKEKGFQFNAIEDLYGKRIGKNAGFRIGGEFEQAEKEQKIIILEASMEVNLKRLSHGRIDGVVGNFNEVALIIKEMNLSGMIVALPRPIREPESAYLIISKAALINDKEALIQQISRAFEGMEKDGTMERIRASYFH